MDGNGRFVAIAGVLGGLVLVAAVVALLFGTGQLDGLLGRPDPVAATPVVTPAPTSTSAAPEPAMLPTVYQGGWGGNQVQPGQPPFPAQIVLTGGSVGDVVGVLTFPTFDCQFLLRLTKVESNDTIELETRLVFGPGCSNARLRLSPDPRTLSYTTYFGDNRVIATGRLTRK